MNQALETFPVHPGTLAPPPWRVLPSAADSAAESFQTHDVRGYRVVAEVAFHHAMQPSADHRHEFVPTSDRDAIAEEGGGTDETRPVEVEPDEQLRSAGGVVEQIWRRIQEERNRPKQVEAKTRGRNNMDRSRAFLVLATTVVLSGFAFLALFSTSGAEKRAQERRTKPSLGRPRIISSAGRSASLNCPTPQC